MILKDKVALITGSTSGIGKAIAIKLSTLGARIVITGLGDPQDIDELVVECRQCNPLTCNADDVCDGPAIRQPTAISVCADLLVDNDVDSLYQIVMTVYGKCDILVHSAGVLQFNDFMTTGAGDGANYMDSYDQEMLFVRNSQRLTQLFLRSLIANKGCICFITGNLDQPHPIILANNLNKSCIDMFSKCLAIELKPYNVRVNCISPGVIATPMVTNVPMIRDIAFSADYINQIPLRRIGTAYDVANAVVGFIVIDNKSNFLTGSRLSVNGGH
ncbi:3-oxoacyl-[acyl-carrier-protein] reductase FabG-like [Oppia nitens]|uniref:3-oxoacyl-[acyl-carrier-protein] reductase FabG-like n=1 Tax=Oppia nitens TaxID=1686743 RepID=UPI0023DB2C8A|nr:3-oxoacyl-[acyl-carrier-protein] reductase FabG-like [Oppia nitens]